MAMKKLLRRATAYNHDDDDRLLPTDYSIKHRVRLLGTDDVISTSPPLTSPHATRVTSHDDVKPINKTVTSSHHYDLGSSLDYSIKHRVRLQCADDVILTSPPMTSPRDARVTSHDDMKPVDSTVTSSHHYDLAKQTSPCEQTVTSCYDALALTPPDSLSPDVTLTSQYTSSSSSAAAGGVSADTAASSPAAHRRRAGCRSKGTPYIPSYMRPEDGPYPCVVCGDAATGHHYRAMTCEGCKGFFRRTVQNSQRLGRSVFTCQNEQRCLIGRDSRNGCQACRFKKCIDSGMAIDSVLKPEQRLAKRQKIEENRLKKQQLATVTAAAAAAAGCCGAGQLAADEHQLTTIITSAYLQHLNLPDCAATQTSVLVDVSQRYSGRTHFLRAYVGTVLIPFSLQAIQFARAIPKFLQLDSCDQSTLIAAGFSQLLCLRIAAEFANQLRYSSPPTATAGASRLLLIGGGLFVSVPPTGIALPGRDDIGAVFQPVIQFAEELSKLELDVTETAMLAAATLVQPELYSGLVQKSAAHSLENILLTALVHYSSDKLRSAASGSPASGHVLDSDTVSLTQKYCALRAELLRAGDTYCREQLAVTSLDDLAAVTSLDGVTGPQDGGQLSASRWTRFVDVPVVQATSSPAPPTAVL